VVVEVACAGVSLACSVGLTGVPVATGSRSDSFASMGAEGASGSAIYNANLRVRKKVAIQVYHFSLLHGALVRKALCGADVNASMFRSLFLLPSLFCVILLYWVCFYRTCYP
jgi:hypothetical protein